MQPTAQSFGCNRATDALGYPARVVLTRSLRHRGCSAAGSWQTPLVETNEKTQDVVDRFSGYNQIPEEVHCVREKLAWQRAVFSGA